MSRTLNGSCGSPVSVNRRDTVPEEGPRPCHLFIPYTHFSPSQVLNWFVLHTAIYIFLSLSLPLSFILFTQNSLSPFILFFVPHIYAPLPHPRQSSALNTVPHTRNKCEPHKPASAYTRLLTQTRVGGTCPSIWKRKSRNPPNQPTQRKFHKERMYFVFYILVYKPSTFSEIISFFKNLKRRKIGIYTRLLAQGVKFTDFFK